MPQLLEDLGLRREFLERGLADRRVVDLDDLCRDRRRPPRRAVDRAERPAADALDEVDVAPVHDEQVLGVRARERRDRRRARVRAAPLGRPLGPRREEQRLRRGPHGRRVERRVVPAVPRLDVRAFREKQLDDLRAVLRRREVQRRARVVVARVDGGLVRRPRENVADVLDVARGGGGDEERPVVDGAQSRARRLEHLRDVVVVVAERVVERRPAPAVGPVQLGAAAHEERDDVMVALGCRDVRRRPPVVVPEVDELRIRVDGALDRRDVAARALEQQQAAVDELLPVLAEHRVRRAEAVARVEELDAIL
mmetsp:Transcript_24237/g.72887  ORF Transcript_24237/g.72887 Transcript_24237/m.72887 type:complete len:310 (-) Transcript_24237:1162-2091(-)